MTEETDKTPSLPTYDPPHTNLAMADPRQVKPLYKFMRQMIKPRVRTRMHKPQKWKKQYPYY